MSIAAGTISLLLMNNNTLDETTNYVWDNIGGVPFSAAVKMEGTHSAGLYADTADTIRTNVVIAETVKSIEFNFYHNTREVNTQYFANDTHANFLFQKGNSNDTMRLFVNGAPQAFFNIGAVQAWRHIGVNMDAANDIEVFLDNVSQATYPSNTVWSGMRWNIGNNAISNTDCRDYIDVARLSSVERASWPTVDPVDGTPKIVLGKFNLGRIGKGGFG